MKYKLMSKAAKLSRMIQYSLVVLSGVLFLPSLVSGQPTPPTGSGGTNGSIPDSPSPLSVPFDNRMSLLLLVAGVLFAVAIILKEKKIPAHKTT